MDNAEAEHVRSVTARRLWRYASMSRGRVSLLVPFAALLCGMTQGITVAAATVGCQTILRAVRPSQPPRPGYAAPVQYPDNEGQDPATFVAPAAVFAKLGVSETSTPLRLERCTLERWFQRTHAQDGSLAVIEPKRMVYEVVTSFDHYANHGGEWGPGFCVFIVDAATGNTIISTTGGHLIKSSRPRVERP